MYERTASWLALLTCLLLSSQAASAQTWTPLAPSGSPPSTYGQPRANYDSTNNRLIVLLPGNPPFESLDTEVWVLLNANGLGPAPAWMQLLPLGTAPALTGLMSAVYDAATNQLIVYGGCVGSCSPASDGVWVLSNANGLGGTPQWSQSTPNASEARDDQSAVYDQNNKLLITFGGSFAFYGTDQNDTRILSKANSSNPVWSTISTAGETPSVREGQATVYDTTHNIMTVFGGVDAISTCCPYDAVDYNDVWTLSNANDKGATSPTWTQLSPRGTPPPPRHDGSAVYDSAHNRMLIFGGTSFSNATQTSTQLGDLWELSNANGLGEEPPRWTQIGQFGTPPGANANHGAVLDQRNERMIVVGGVDRDSNPHIHVFVLAIRRYVDR